MGKKKCVHISYMFTRMITRLPQLNFQSRTMKVDGKENYLLWRCLASRALKYFCSAVTDSNASLSSAILTLIGSKCSANHQGLNGWPDNQNIGK